MLQNSGKETLLQDMLNRIHHEVSQGAVFGLLPDETQARIRELPDEAVWTAARNVLTRPQPGDASQAGRLLLNPCLAASWLVAFEGLDLPRSLSVFEPCAGSSEPVILASEVYSAGTGRYTTVNLNRPLAAELRGKLGKLRMPLDIIEDNAADLAHPLPPDSVDIACFHHAVNDILQTAVSEPRGIDTATIDWWPNERRMIEWLGEDDVAGRLDEYARPALVSVIRNAVEMVKPGGVLLFDHWTWEAHRNVDWFPWGLFNRLIPLARAWVLAEDLPVVEVPLPGRDPQWWMCLTKAG
jgi:SAM-dependent methyltransferase